MTTRIITGDCRDVLPTLDAGSVQCVVTSPPYFGLRDYGTADWDGGDPECDHVQAPHSSMRPERSRASSSTFHGSMSTNNSTSTGTPYRDICGKCGATRIDRQIGLEPTVDAYVAELVAVFREVRSGSIWGIATLGTIHRMVRGRIDQLPTGDAATSITSLCPNAELPAPWRILRMSWSAS
jgi:hypothetical protein